MKQRANKKLIDKISLFQKKWADGIKNIGEAVINDLDEKEIKIRANQMLENLYDFKRSGHVLFKPTKAEENPFRFNKRQTLSYFIGGKYKEDKGFALTPWKEVFFKKLKSRNVILQDCDILVMSSYIFKDYNGGETEVEYTFGYREDEHNDLKIFLHHSSLPFESGLSPALSFKEEAKNEKGLTGFRVTLPGDFRYNRDKEISNSYFSHKPAAIAFPRATSQVSFAIRQYLLKNKQMKKGGKIPLRIMSGGHQHEGMSSTDDAFIIRLSELGNIVFNEDKTEAWIPAGMKLGTVYQELAFHRKIIPAGGCMNVNVGGLSQGGGWGMYSRKYGLTCDNILAAEMVLANGDIVQASPKSHADLFWAIRGGGGGNFGVVTRLQFKLQPLRMAYYRFNFCWERNDMKKVIEKWLEIQKEFPGELTSFLRITALADDQIEGENFPLYASGTFTGKVIDFLKLAKLLDRLPKPKKQKYGYKKGSEWKYVTKRNDIWIILKDFFDVSNEAISSMKSIIELYSYDSDNSSQNEEDKTTLPESKEKCKVAYPESNCGAPHPHKVTSAFSNQTGKAYYRQVADSVTEYFENTVDVAPENYFRYVRSYLTFHSMGGAMAEIPNSESAFAFRDSEFLIQIQSWWNYPTGETGKDCRKEKKWQQPYIDWVTNFRRKLAEKNLVKGAFINFVDKDLGPDYTTDEGKYELLKEYYGDNLDELIKVKKAYDSGNVFNFELSIPTEKPK